MLALKLYSCSTVLKIIDDCKSVRCEWYEEHEYFDDEKDDEGADYHTVVSTIENPWLV